MSRKTFSFPLLGLVVLTVAACDDQKQHAAAPAPAPVEVTAITLEPQHVALSTELPGRTVAYRVADVRPQVSGIIQKRLFQEGSEVKAGQQLYQIDPASYQATLASAKADLAKAKANLKSVEAKAARYADLVQIDAVSKQDYDDVVATLDQDKAQILVAEAEVQTASINLEYTRVIAPITGRIGKSTVTEGALVTASQTSSMATITQLDPIFVDVNQSSSDLIRLREAVAAGQIKTGGANQAPVTLMLDGAAKGYAYPGKLQFSEVTVDQSTGAVQLRAVFPNPNHDLFPGLFVRARIEQGGKDQAILVPQRSLVRNPNGSAFVWLVGTDNKVLQRQVEVGQAIGDAWLVDKGLEPGDKVVTDGLQKIKVGAEVRAIAGPAKAAADTPNAAAAAAQR
ncbi:efflux RND transporter periplasmic adaptor subunit [Telmatospirillum sp.]|uniref:efflux RND transporter periplasmic adaptor subunit n=1 Tax=Telmatospirillum sp. TaxID=2079197 RepID=UPI0028512903|nr:efflux RND transporter periplasmic adaptor subunit [Telmatospirillum sp.]MDR3438891.1 efflux RND transporter periplasmic adaptor subunit [Telmatospirillum sp.]